jgi:hypothetical protein
VPEPEGRLTGQRRERLARQQLSVDEVRERRVDVERRVELEDRATPEHAADQGTVAEDRAGSRRERVDARGDQRLQRVRDPHGGALALLDQHSDRLLDEQRVPFGLLEEDAAKPVGQRRPLDEGVHELGRLRVGQRRELDRDRAAPAPSPAGPRIEQLGASEADDEHWCVVDAVGEVLDEVEERLLRPVDVLEPEDEGLRLREARRPLVRGPRDLLPAAWPRDVVQHARCEAEQVGDGVARARLAQLLDRLLGRVVVGDPGRSLHHLRERAVGDSLAERRAASRQDTRPLQPGVELLCEPALADSRIAEDRHELRSAVPDDAVEHVAQQLELLVAADVRRRDVERPPDGTVGADDAPDDDLAVEPLERALADRLDRHPARREAVRRRPDQDLAGLRALLEPRRDVEGLTGRERRVARLRDDLARLDPDADGKVAVTRLEDRDSRAHGALGVVLVRDRDAEYGDDRVARELLDGAAVRGDVRGGPLEEGGHASPDDLRVASGDECGGVDEIDEQRRRELALHA